MNNTFHICILLSIAVLAVSTRARAEDSTHEAEDGRAPLSDLHGREPPIEDLAPRANPTLLDPAEPTLSLTLSTQQSDRRRDYAGSVLLKVPTDFFLSPIKAKTDLAHDEGGDSEPSEPPPGNRAPPRSDQLTLSRVRSGDAREAVAAARRAAGFGHQLGALDDMASRARWSALLPQVRLRATRLIDESNSLSPTSYDANRTTSSGGASLWLEARTTWSLDRTVFADEEVRIERLRQSIHDDQRALERDILDLVFRWQKAHLLIADPSLSPQRCLELALEADHISIELDLKTDGWLARWRRKQSTPLPSCDDHFDEPTPLIEEVNAME